MVSSTTTRSNTQLKVSQISSTKLRSTTSSNSIKAKGSFSFKFDYCSSPFLLKPDDSLRSCSIFAQYWISERQDHTHLKNFHVKTEVKPKALSHHFR